MKTQQNLALHAILIHRDKHGSIVLSAEILLEYREKLSKTLSSADLEVFDNHCEVFLPIKEQYLAFLEKYLAWPFKSQAEKFS